MNMQYKLKFILLFFASTLIGTIHAQSLKKGIWRGVLMLDAKNNIELPFNFEVNIKNSKTQLTIINADERILVDELFFKKDSLIIKMPVFDTEFRTRIYPDSLVGVWINYARKDKNIITFKAFANNKNRFVFQNNSSNQNISDSKLFDGKWEVTFSPNTNDSSKAIGVFNRQANQKFTGTFLTETGDYRFLEGTQFGNTLYLSGFDGSHAFLFTAENDLNNKKINGLFYSGISWKENWLAIKNDSFQLRSAESITKLNPGFETINFKFPNSENKMISLTDERYKNKVVIVQLLGSWCPNCMDETAYLSEIYNKYNKSGLEIIGLAYERTNDFKKASGLVDRLKKRFNVDYEILITGLTGKDKASDTFPMLNKISAFPTTIIIDREGKVNTIHTGFSGPATGKAYLEFTQKNEKLLEQLLK
jgi:thiol-disulfide isomerase/thioredoxin